jgi:hypothetical protein
VKFVLKVSVGVIVKVIAVVNVARQCQVCHELLISPHSVRSEYRMCSQEANALQLLAGKYYISEKETLLCAQVTDSINF